jgi:protein phosphatase PTC7
MVADGVGGWGIKGGDSSKVSVGLLEEMKSVFLSKSGKNLPLEKITQAAFVNLSKQQLSSGSTTLTAALIDHETSTLHVANIGDSGTYVFRGKRIIYKSEGK